MRFINPFLISVWFAALVLLSTVPARSQSLEGGDVGTGVSTAKAPSTKVTVDPKVLEGILQNQCAQAVTPAPAKTEGDVCLDCAKEHTVSNPAAAVQAVSAALDEKAQLEREIAFYAMLKKDRTLPRQLSLGNDPDEELKSQMIGLERAQKRLQKTQKFQSAIQEIEHGKRPADKTDLMNEIQTLIQRLENKLFKKDGTPSQGKALKNSRKRDEDELSNLREIKDWLEGKAGNAPDIRAIDSLRMSLEMAKSPKDAKEDIWRLEDSIQALKAVVDKKNAEETRLKADTSLEGVRAYHRYVEADATRGLKTVDKPAPRPCGLTVAESIALMSYTGLGYEKLNYLLRQGGEIQKEYLLFRDILNSALSKLRPYEGLVRRGAVLPEELLKEYQVGSVIEAKAFTSTSLAGGFEEKHRFIIQSKTGRYIGVFSDHTSEYEVLIPAGARFKVLQREEGEGGKVNFILEEITSSDVQSP